MRNLPQAITAWREELQAQHDRAVSKSAPRWARFIVMPLRIITAVIQDFFQGQLTLRAMSLVYTTLLSLVPLLAISFSVLKGFGVHNKTEPFLNKVLAPLGQTGAEITTRIIGFVDRIEVGVLGIVGFLLLFYTGVSLLQKVERSLNYIWHVPTERSIAHKFRDYLSAVILGPVLVIGATGMIATLMSSSLMKSITSMGGIGSVIELAGQMTSLALVIAAFTFIYAFMPNTRVRLGPAFCGGLVAGILWAVIGWGFASFVVNSANFTVVYSAFAALVLFMIWLYLVWLIVLVGSAVSFYVQNPHYIGVKRDAARYGTALVEQVALIAAYHVVGSWYRGEEPWSADRLAREAHVPMPVLARVLASLEKAGLFERAGDDEEVFLPARPPEATPVKDLLDAVRADEGTGDLSAVEFGVPGPVARVLTRVSTAVGEELTGVTVKDLALMDEAPEGPVASAHEAPDLKSI